MIFITQFNGDQPFWVKVTKGRARVYPRLPFVDGDVDTLRYDTVPCRDYTVSQVWIGDCPDEPGRYRGNSILLHLRDFEYVFIGDQVFHFRTRSPIVDFVARMGNNNVPYPYATDEKGQTYLLAEQVVLKTPVHAMPGTDPYRWFYDHAQMSPDAQATEPWTQTNILKAFVGRTAFNLQFTPRPKRDYNVQTQNGRKSMFIVTRQAPQKRQRVTQDGYARLMKAHGARLHIRGLRVRVVSACHVD